MCVRVEGLRWKPLAWGVFCPLTHPNRALTRHHSTHIHTLSKCKLRGLMEGEGRGAAAGREPEQSFGFENPAVKRTHVLSDRWKCVIAAAACDGSMCFRQARSHRHVLLDPRIVEV